MTLEKQNQNFDNNRYLKQSNIVYISTFFGFFIIIPLFAFTGSLLIIGLSLLSMIVSAIAYFLNKHGRYGLASILFISAITLQSASEIFVFGLEPGFGYYFFNMSVLIVFTNWKGWVKFSSIGLEVAVFITSFLIMRGQVPPVIMAPWLVITFHTLNVVLNTLGVANSTHFYQLIASDAYQKISQLATTDYLTNIPNRTAFGDYLAEVVEHHKKHADATGIMMIDIDHFKNINDTYGHFTGDFVLKSVASQLNMYLEDEDFLGRYGGEEFVFIKHNVTVEQFVLLAEKIRKDIEEKHFIFEQAAFHITISIGAFFNGEHEHVDCHLAVKNADELLYQAKRSGRNVVIHN